MGQPTILLFGADGQLGRALQPALRALGTVVPSTREDVNLTDADAIASRIGDVAPDVVVNAAAFTDVDRAESEPELASAINARAPGVMAEEARAVGAAILHYSTDYVFDGTADRPYTESDPPNPQSIYGQTKWEGEQAIQTSGGRHWILRTSWLYGIRGHNFVRTMLRLGRERSNLQVVDDQTGCPTSATWLAHASANVLRQAVNDPSCPHGVFHAVSRGQTSWYGFARAIFAQFEVNVDVEPVSTDAFPRPAPRPAYSALDTRRLQHAFGIRPTPWTEQLAEFAASTSAETT
jgi:dTDP-4-dehydrorhamnose reductase